MQHNLEMPRRQDSQVTSKENSTKSQSDATFSFEEDQKRREGIGPFLGSLNSRSILFIMIPAIQRLPILGSPPLQKTVIPFLWRN